MSQEDKPCSQHPNAPHGFDRNTSHNVGRYVCECEGWEPVAAQEPAVVLANKLALRPIDCWRPTAIEAQLIIAALYANAEPCARCTELEAEIMCIYDVRDNKPWRELREAQAKITEQAAEIERLTNECDEHLAFRSEAVGLANVTAREALDYQKRITQQAARIKALEAEAAANAGMWGSCAMRNC